MNEEIKCFGKVHAVIAYNNGKKEEFHFNNSVLKKGREALAKGIVNDIGESFGFYVSRMLFGDGGTIGGVPRKIESTRNGLYGTTRANKPVIASVDPNITTQAVFTSVLSTSDANDYELNEIALQMNNGDLYSMATWPGLTKTDQMQITWNWRIFYV